MARHQVQLSVAPPFHGDVHAQRRLETAVSFGDVLAALWAAQTEAAAAVRSVAPEIMARENAEAFLKAANAEVEALRKDVKILHESNAKKDAMLAKDLTRLHCAVQARDAFIATLNKKLAREREVYKSSIGAIAEQTRKLHLLLVKLAKVLENQQDRNTRLLQVKRTLRAHLSLAGMDPEVLRLPVDGLTAGELDLDALDLDQETLVALLRIQSAVASSDDPQALPAALAKAAHQVADGKSHKRLRPDDELGDSDEDKAPIPTDKAVGTSVAVWSEGMEASGPEVTPEDSPSPSRQVAPTPRSKSVPTSPSSWSPPPTPAAPAVVDLSGDQSDVDKVDVDSSGVPSAQEAATESSGKDVEPGDHDDVPGLPDAPSPLPQGPLDVTKPPASTISPSPADIRAAEEALREAKEMRLMFGSSDEGEEPDNTVPPGKTASSSAATFKTVEISGVFSIAGPAPVEAVPQASVSSKPAPTVPTAAVPGVSSPDFSMKIDDDENVDDVVEIMWMTTNFRWMILLMVQVVAVMFRHLPNIQVQSMTKMSKIPTATGAVLSVVRLLRHRQAPSSPPVPASPRQFSRTIGAGPGRKITTTYTSVPRRGGAPSVEPLPGARPTVPASSTLPPWVLPYLDMAFADAGAKMCFERLLSMTLPERAGEVTVRRTLEGLHAYFDYSNPDHPYEQLRQRYPLQACLFDTVDFDPSVPISKRASIETRLKMICASLRGDGGKQGDLGFALWERLHWLPLAGIERGLVEEAKKVSHDKELLKELRALLKMLFSERDRRADRLRNKYREQYMAWRRDLVSSGTSDSPFIRPELLLEPSKSWYPIENLPFAPRTSDWLPEVPALDARQPWRTGWMNAAHQHPYHTTYFPCQCNPELFNPRGTRFVDVYRSVLVDPSLEANEFIPFVV
ncbi:hypothetical protein PInf_025240 [Phytophthora infestans]|nr:hypothetical protein PInf_025240 [Phytophthora infestans]